MKNSSIVDCICIMDGTRRNAWRCGLGDLLYWSTGVLEHWSTGPFAGTNVVLVHLPQASHVWQSVYWVQVCLGTKISSPEYSVQRRQTNLCQDWRCVISLSVAGRQ